MEAREALLRIKDVIEHYGDEKVKHSFYLEFNRRLLVLRLIEEYNPKRKYHHRFRGSAVNSELCA